MVTVEEEDHGSGAPREAGQEAGAILTDRTILHHQEYSKSNNLHVPNVVLVEANTQPQNALVVAFHAAHGNMLGDSVLTGVLNRMGAVERNVWKTWHLYCGILK